MLTALNTSLLNHLKPLLCYVMLCNHRSLGKYTDCALRLHKHAVGECRTDPPGHFPLWTLSPLTDSPGQFDTRLGQLPPLVCQTTQPPELKCVHTYIHTYNVIHKYIHTYIYKYIHTHVYIHTYIHIY